jgi:hypothetical protein
MLKSSFFILLIIYLILSGCSYGSPVTASSIVNVSRIPESRIIAVLVQRTTLRRPEGLAAFPDGGKSKILGAEAAIYLFDIDKKVLRMLCVFRNSSNQLIGFSPWLIGWEGEDLYLQTRGCAPTWEVDSHGCWEPQITSQYYKVNSLGSFLRVAMIPKILKSGSNSPLAPAPNEINYTRISSDSNSIEATITDANGFYRILKLDNQGSLKQVESK